LQTDAGYHRTRRGPAGVRQFEDLAIELRLLEVVRGSALEIASDLSLAEPGADLRTASSVWLGSLLPSRRRSPSIARRVLLNTLTAF
jgi:hypothetical protein